MHFLEPHISLSITLLTNPNPKKIKPNYSTQLLNPNTIISHPSQFPSNSKQHLKLSPMTSSSSSSRLPAYQRLTHDEDLDDDEFDFEKNRVVVRSRTNNATTSWCRFRPFRRVHIRRRSFKLRVPSLRRLLSLRRKVKVISALCAKVVRRFKEGQSHFGDLFAGNYLFVQVSPSSLKALHNKGTTTQHSLQFSKPYALPSKNIA